MLKVVNSLIMTERQVVLDTSVYYCAKCSNLSLKKSLSRKKSDLFLYQLKGNLNVSIEAKHMRAQAKKNTKTFSKNCSLNTFQRSTYKYGRRCGASL